MQETFTENRSSPRTRVNSAGSDGRCRAARAGETAARRVGLPECLTHREKQRNTLRRDGYRRRVELDGNCGLRIF
ncbi:hypothetical protein CFP56_012576 [Quercus suber]|uniref:Uncharacterized protein n=1 Tax=Quercus suber TaxID=58331 RepID=A0AAW0KYR2_QUESU